MQLPWLTDVTRHPFVPLQVKEIATKIFDRIALSQYPYGTRIPAERDLAEEFKQSRATIRHALDFLAAYDVVVRKPGSGTFVSYNAPEPAEAVVASTVTSAGYPTISQLAETASPFAMNIAGSIIEPEMVRLATIYMSSRDIAELAQQVAMLEDGRDRSGHVRGARGRVHDDHCPRNAQFSDRRDVRHFARGSAAPAVGRKPPRDADTGKDPKQPAPVPLAVQCDRTEKRRDGR